MRVVPILIGLFAIAGVGFSGFVIVDHVLSQRQQDERKRKAEEELRGGPNQAPPAEGKMGIPAIPLPEADDPGDAGPGDVVPEGGRAGGFDPIAIFEQRDADGDGKLSAEEMSDRMRERLADIDTDKDGAISREEWQERIRKRREGGGGAAGDGQEGGQDKRPKRPQRPPMA